MDQQDLPHDIELDDDHHSMMNKARIEQSLPPQCFDALLKAAVGISSIHQVAESLGVNPSDKLKQVAQDASNLVKFVKTHSYPAENTTQFFELTDLCHALECSLRDAGYQTA